MNKQQTRHFTCDSKQRFQENFQFISLWRSAVFVYMDHRKHNTSSALCLSILSSTFFFLLEVDSFFFGIDLWFMGVILIKSLLRATDCWGRLLPGIFRGQGEISHLQIQLLIMFYLVLPCAPRVHSTVRSHVPWSSRSMRLPFRYLGLGSTNSYN